MKKVLTLLAATVMVAQANNGILNIEAPSIKYSCSMSDASFTLYKGTRCTGGGTDFLRPRCIEYRIKKSLGIDVTEAVYYSDQEAVVYLEKECMKKKNSTVKE